MKKIFIHGSGHKAASWNKTVCLMDNKENILCPELSDILGDRQATYHNLYSCFSDYCNAADGRVHLCGLSLGGILALNYASDNPQKVASLVLIGAPHKVPKAAFALQNLIFRFLPECMFDTMAFDKKNTFALGNTMKRLDFSDRVQNVSCPAMIVCGKKDGANLKSARYFEKNIKGANLKVLEDVGHVVNEENPEELANILNAFYGGL